MNAVAGHITPDGVQPPGLPLLLLVPTGVMMAQIAELGRLQGMSAQDGYFRVMVGMYGFARLSPARARGLARVVDADSVAALNAADEAAGRPEVWRAAPDAEPVPFDARWSAVLRGPGVTLRAPAPPGYGGTGTDFFTGALGDSVPVWSERVARLGWLTVVTGPIASAIPGRLPDAGDADRAARSGDLCARRVPALVEP